MDILNKFRYYRKNYHLNSRQLNEFSSFFAFLVVFVIHFSIIFFYKIIVTYISSKKFGIIFFYEQ